MESGAIAYMESTVVIVVVIFLLVDSYLLMSCIRGAPFQLNIHISVY